MPTGLPLLIVVVVAALLLMAAYGAYVERMRRPQQLGALAIQLGWHFDLREDPDRGERCGIFGVFEKGDSRRAYNTLEGAIEIGDRMWPVQAGDYMYRTTSGTGNDRRTQTHRLSYAIIDTPHLGAPDLSIRRQGLFDRFAGFLGFDDINFESNEFNERFHVKSSDKRFAYAVIDPRMMEFLLQDDPPAMELRLGRCCLLHGERCWTPEQFAATFAWAREFFARWPSHVPSVLDS
jgi:hypothetical protein